MASKVHYPESLSFFYFMETKKCKKCQEVKCLEDFTKHNKSVGGRTNKCKSCSAKYQLLYTAKVSTPCQKSYQRDYFKKNKGKLYRREKYCRITCPEYILKLLSYREKEKQGKIGSKKSYAKKKELFCRLTDACYLAKIKHYATIKRRERSNARCREARRLRRQSDVMWRFSMGIRCNISTAFSRACKGSFKKNERSFRILGCSFEDFASYISSKFTEGMTLENYGQWHLDHIMPLATAKTREDVVRLNHYTNFQPLWAKDNLSKGSKII